MMLPIIRFSLAILMYLFLITARAATTIDTPPELYYPTVNTVAGNPTGKITVVEFFDYRCVYCRKMPAILTALMKANPDIRMVYRDYPVLGLPSLVAATSALSAQQQGKYMQLHNDLFSSSQPLDINNIKQIAARHGVNTEEMEKDNLSYLTQQQIRENARLALALGVDGIPTLFVAPTPLSTQHESIEAYRLTSPTLTDLQNVINLIKRSN